MRKKEKNEYFRDKLCKFWQGLHHEDYWPYIYTTFLSMPSP